MFPGSPAPLPPSVRLELVLRLIRPGIAAGVWVRASAGLRRAHPLRAPGRRTLLLASDLGWLLRRADRVVVGDGGAPRLLPAGHLVRCRVLEIVLGTPYLPAPALLRELFPGVRESPGALTVPVGLGSPEEALALCAAHSIPVRSSRIAYAGRCR